MCRYPRRSRTLTTPTRVAAHTPFNPAVPSTGPSDRLTAKAESRHAAHTQSAGKAQEEPAPFRTLTYPGLTPLATVKNAAVRAAIAVFTGEKRRCP